jgi:hypothetical protein
MIELPFLVDKVNLTINKEAYTVACSTQQHSIIPGYEFVTALVWTKIPYGPYPSLFLRILLVTVLGISLHTDLVELCIFKLQRKAADIPPLLVSPFLLFFVLHSQQRNPLGGSKCILYRLPGSVFLQETLLTMSSCCPHLRVSDAT